MTPIVRLGCELEEGDASVVAGTPRILLSLVNGRGLSHENGRTLTHDNGRELPHDNGRGLEHHNGRTRDDGVYAALRCGRTTSSSRFDRMITGAFAVLRRGAAAFTLTRRMRHPVP